MEGYSDGVFSIASTLLVLDIALHPPGTPLEQVLDAWPEYLGYLVSFLTISAAWFGHNALTGRLARVDPILLRLNVLLLLVIAFLPFPTKLMAESLHDVNGERVFVTLYGLTLLAIRLLGLALDGYADREHLYAREESDESRITDRRMVPLLIGYAIAICIGLALPTLAVLLYFALAAYLVVPFSEVRRVFRRS